MGARKDAARKRVRFLSAEDLLRRALVLLASGRIAQGVEMVRRALEALQRGRNEI